MKRYWIRPGKKVRLKKIDPEDTGNYPDDESGKAQEFTVWNATDLKDFPIQFETTEKGNTVHCKYRDIQFTKPDARLFDAPAGFKSYPDMQEMMMSMMQKFMQENLPQTPSATPHPMPKP